MEQQKEIYTEKEIPEFKSLSSVLAEIQSAMGSDRALSRWFLSYGPMDEDQLLDEEMLLDKVVPAMLDNIKNIWQLGEPNSLVQTLGNAYRNACANRDDYLKSVLPNQEQKIFSTVIGLPTEDQARQSARKARNIDRGGIGFDKEIGGMVIRVINGNKLTQALSLKEEAMQAKEGYERSTRLRSVLQRVRAEVKRLNEKIDLSTIRVAIYSQAKVNGLSKSLTGYGAQQVATIQDLETDLMPGDFDVLVLVNEQKDSIDSRSISANYAVEVVQVNGTAEGTARSILQRLDQVREAKLQARQINVVH